MLRISVASAAVAVVHALHQMIRFRFGLRVPFARDDAAGATKAPATAHRIIIVEDDYLIAYEVEAALADAGYNIVGVASSAEEAIGIAAAQRPVLAVMDIRLSGARDGIDAALELFEKYGVRCVFATAHQTSEAHLRAEPAKPLAWLPKPYTMDALVVVVRRALSDLRR